METTPDVLQSVENAAQLSLYRCHKLVRAAKIANISIAGLRVYLHLINGCGIGVDVDWCEKHKPTIGGYFVIYADGYKSFSPAKAFEEEYTLETPAANNAAVAGATVDELDLVPLQDLFAALERRFDSCVLVTNKIARAKAPPTAEGN